MKKTLTVFAALMLVALAVPHSALAQDFSAVAPSGQMLYYNIVDGAAQVTTSHYSGYVSGDLVIPSSVVYNGNTYSVTSIGVQAFSFCSRLTSVTIPNSVTSIGNYAFWDCSGLTSVTIPESVTSIGVQAFFYCSGLTSVTIPDSVTSIGNYAFSGVRHIEYYGTATGAPWGAVSMNGVTEGDFVFSSVTHDTLIAYIGTGGDVVIPDSVTSIGNSAFSSCSGLTSVTIPNSVTSIGEGVFYGCNGLTSVTIPNSVTSIGTYAFYGCSGLTSVTIPNSVTSIGDYVFAYCYGLTSVTIPNSVTSIGQEAFRNCSGLTSVTIPNSVTSIGYYAFYGCRGLTSLTIPNSVTSIGNGAFLDCSGLTSVTIPNSVTSIGDSTFFYCSGLTSVTIPNSVTSIGEEAFSWCSGLTSVTIPNSVTSIGNSAFSNCSGLTSVTIPNSVTSIGNEAFMFVRHIEYYGTATGAPWGAFSMNGVTEGDFIFSNAMHDTLIAYIGAGGDVVIPNSVTSIGDGAFYGCSGLTSVTIPNSVTSIGEAAFWGCSGLTSVVFNADSCAIPTDYDYRPFSGCSNISSFVFGDSVRYIPAYICSELTGLTSVTIPSSVSSIDEGAFAYCIGLTSVTIPNSVTSIGEAAFWGCSGLTSVTISESVSSIGDYAFAYSLTSSDTLFVLAEVPPAITSTTFEGVPTNVRIQVPCSTLEDYQEATYWNSFTNISEALCYTIVTAVPNNAAYGSVSGGGSYSSGNIATLAAIPHNGYAFTGWADGNTDNPRLVLVSGDTTYTANFAPAVLEPVHDTTVVTVVDTVTLTEYVTVHDTVDNYIYDTTIVTDTLWLTLYDTVYITDTVIIHDTVYVPENGIDGVATTNIRLYQHNGQIVVEDADGGVLPEVVVYDAVGRKMETALAGGASAYQFDVPASGVYLVKIGDRPARRIVVVR